LNGDGICCDFGNGSITIEHVGSDGQPAKTHITDFTGSERIVDLNCEPSPAVPPRAPIPPGWFAPSPPHERLKTLFANWGREISADRRTVYELAGEGEFAFEQRCTHRCSNERHCVGFVIVRRPADQEQLCMQDERAVRCCALYTARTFNGKEEFPFFTVHPLFQQEVTGAVGPDYERYIRHRLEPQEQQRGGDGRTQCGPSPLDPCPLPGEASDDDGFLSGSGNLVMTLVLVFLAGAALGAGTHVVFIRRFGRTREPKAYSPTLTRELPEACSSTDAESSAQLQRAAGLKTVRSKATETVFDDASLTSNRL